MLYFDTHNSKQRNWREIIYSVHSLILWILVKRSSFTNFVNSCYIRVNASLLCHSFRNTGVWQSIEFYEIKHSETVSEVVRMCVFLAGQNGSKGERIEREPSNRNASKQMDTKLPEASLRCLQRPAVGYGVPWIVYEEQTCQMSVLLSQPAFVSCSPQFHIICVPS